MSEGHSAGQIILQLHDCIVTADMLNDRQKSAVCERLAVSNIYLLILSFICCHIMNTGPSHRWQFST